VLEKACGGGRLGVVQLNLFDLVKSLWTKNPPPATPRERLAGESQIGWFGVIPIPTILTATICYIIAFIAAPPVDIDGIREPVSGSLLYAHNFPLDLASGDAVPMAFTALAIDG